MFDKIKHILEWNGLGHGLVTAAVMLIAYCTTFSPFISTAAGLASCVYWYDREAKARGTYNILEFKYPDGEKYTDSMFDALVPILVFIALSTKFYGGW